MSDFDAVEKTLFVPMLGRIYASENCRSILYDEKALALKPRLPQDIFMDGRQNQYTLLASAVRSRNMDCLIREFLSKRKDGVVVQLGCGLETTFSRNDNGKSLWYEVDLPEVIEYRRQLIRESERDIYVPCDAFTSVWIKKAREENPDCPIMVVAGGLFHYFGKDKVLSLMRMMQRFGNIEIVFDAVNGCGLAMMKRRYMKKMGHDDAKMYFHVDSAKRLALEIGCGAKVAESGKYFGAIGRKGLKLSTRLSMDISDLLGMLRMIHLVL